MGWNNSLYCAAVFDCPGNCVQHAGKRAVVEVDQALHIKKG